MNDITANLKLRIEVLKAKKDYETEPMFKPPTWWRLVPDQWKQFVQLMDGEGIIDFRPMREGNKPRLVKDQKKVLAIVDVLITRNMVVKGRGGAVAFILRNLCSSDGGSLNEGSIRGSYYDLKAPRIGREIRGGATLLMDQIAE